MTKREGSLRHSARSTRERPAAFASFVFVAFAAVVALAGGSSRFDMVQNVVLLPVGVLAAALAWTQTRGVDWRPLGWPLALLVLLALWIFLQLVPLPHSLWASLPGHSAPAAVDAALSLDPARPLTLSPERTLNDFFSLGVPIAAVLLFVALRRHAVGFAFTAVVAIATSNALLAVLQILSGGNRALYFYRLTSTGTPVGLFANPNHAAVLNTLVMVAVAVAIAIMPAEPKYRIRKIVLGAIYILLLLAAIAGTSRAGFLTALLAVLATCAIFSRPFLQRRVGSGGKKGRVVVGIGAIVLILLLGAFILTGRAPALEQLTGQDALGDIRFLVTPTLLEMIRSYFPFGSGFGTFQNVYYVAESSQMLMPRYLNNAHNDWLQLAIEGGLPALLLLVGLLTVLGREMLRLWRERAPSAVALVVGGGAGLLLVALASYVDYPLRTPIFQVVCVWLVCLLLTSARGPSHESDADHLSGFPNYSRHHMAVRN
ncbi:hypothetical protein F7D01_13535 [Erythrobacter sp. 3-20A1M]|nr:hypothetical protein F7D01_13535 [Erythrobacter sp. 3-20A1M]